VLNSAIPASEKLLEGLERMLIKFFSTLPPEKVAESVQPPSVHVETPSTSAYKCRSVQQQPAAAYARTVEGRERKIITVPYNRPIVAKQKLDSAEEDMRIQMAKEKIWHKLKKEKDEREAWEAARKARLAQQEQPEEEPELPNTPPKEKAKLKNGNRKKGKVARKILESSDDDDDYDPLENEDKPLPLKRERKKAVNYLESDDDEPPIQRRKKPANRLESDDDDGEPVTRQTNAADAKDTDKLGCIPIEKTVRTSRRGRPKGSRNKKTLALLEDQKTVKIEHAK
jgi:hypothetical protein